MKPVHIHGPRARRPRLVPMTAALAMLAASLVPIEPGRACDSHAIYTGTLMQDGKTGVFLGLFDQYTDFSDVRENNKPAPNTDDEWIHSSITQLMVGYAFTPRLGLQASVPLISRDFRRMEGGMTERGNVGGLGDVSVIGRFTALNRTVAQTLVHLEAFAGVKTPTGSSGYLNEAGHHEEEEVGHHGYSSQGRTARHGDEDHGGGEDDDADEDADDDADDEPGGHEGVVHGHDLALGSGSVDGLFGLNAFTSWKRFFASARLQYAIRGKGDFTYNFANDVYWEFGPGYYLVAEGSWTAAASLLFSGDHKGRDRQYGSPVDGTDLTSVYIGPNVGLTWKDALRGDIAVAMPILQDVSDAQLVANYRLRAGLTWRF